MVVMSTEIGKLAEIESKMTERSVPPFTTSHSLSAGASAEMRIDIRLSVDRCGSRRCCARGALHVEVALKMIASRFERRPAEQLCRSIEVACGLRSAQHVPVDNAHSARAAAVEC
jgi:hypothetical protein